MSQQRLGKKGKGLKAEPAQGQDKIKASLKYERQKYYTGRKQMELFEAITEDQSLEALKEADELNISGLEKLELSQLRYLHMLQVLLHRTGYEGDLPKVKYTSNRIPYLPRLAVPNTEAYEIYGLKRGSSGKFSNREIEEFHKAGQSLAQPFRIVLSRKTGTKKIKGKDSNIYDVIVRNAPMIVDLAKGYKNVTDGEVKQLQEGDDIPDKRAGYLIITPGPLLLDFIDTPWILKPINLYRELADHLGKKPKRIQFCLIEYLLTLDLQFIRMGLETMAETLNEQSLIRQRKKNELKDKIAEALNTARDLGYLLSWKIGSWGGYELVLNPEKAGRKLKNNRPGEALAEAPESES